MTTVSVEEIQRDLQSYLDRVAAGETLIVVRHQEPIAELRPATEQAQSPRPFGLCAGEFTVPTDFDAALPEEVLSGFEGR